MATGPYHMANLGSLASALKGAELEACRVTFGAAGAPTLVDAGRSNFITGVVKTATGRYTFQMSPAYPPKIIALLPKLSVVNATGARLDARYVEGSYNSTTGQFEVDISDATPIAIDPTASTALDIIMIFERYKTI